MVRWLIILCICIGCSPTSLYQVKKLSRLADDGYREVSLQQAEYWYAYYIKKYNSSQVAHDSAICKVGQHLIKIHGTPQEEKVIKFRYGRQR